MPDELIPGLPPSDGPGAEGEPAESDAPPLDEMPVAPLTDEDETMGG